MVVNWLVCMVKVFNAVFNFKLIFWYSKSNKNKKERFK